MNVSKVPDLVPSFTVESFSSSSSPLYSHERNTVQSHTARRNCNNIRHGYGTRRNRKITPASISISSTPASTPKLSNELKRIGNFNNMGGSSRGKTATQTSSPSIQTSALKVSSELERTYNNDNVGDSNHRKVISTAIPTATRKVSNMLKIIGNFNSSGTYYSSIPPTRERKKRCLYSDIQIKTTKKKKRRTIGNAKTEKIDSKVGRKDRDSDNDNDELEVWSDSKLQSQSDQQSNSSRQSWEWLLAPDGSTEMANVDYHTTNPNREDRPRNRDWNPTMTTLLNVKYEGIGRDENHRFICFHESMSETRTKSFGSRDNVNGRYQLNHEGWISRFKCLVEYKKKHGTTQPRPYKSVLCNWVRHQKGYYKEGNMPEYRVQLLNSIGLEWENKKFVPWIEMYNQLLAYKKKHHGSTNIPRTSVKNKTLETWINTNRTAYSKNHIPQDRIDLLNKIGFEWNTHDATWMRFYHGLVAFKNKYGHTRVSRRYKPFPRLGHWVKKQRRSCLREHRIDLLNEIGFIWDARAKVDLEGNPIKVQKVDRNGIPKIR